MDRRSFLKGSAGLSLLVAAPSVFSQRLNLDQRWDVIVIGTGLAGLSAAVSARENGAESVLVIEKSPLTGGHSRLSTGSFSVYSPRRAEALGFKDSEERFVQEIMEAGGRINSEPLVRTLVANSEAAIDWLEEKGVIFEPQPYIAVGGISPRTYKARSSLSGLNYVRAVNLRAQELGVRFIYNTPVVDLLKDSSLGAITGVVIKRPHGVQYLNAKSVIIATGGYTANGSLCKKFNPEIDIFAPTTANPWRKGIDTATGDGLIMAMQAGADTIDLEHIQCIPFLGGRLTDYAGGDIFVNSEGKRFVNEASPLGTISAALRAQTNQKMWAITDSVSQKGTSIESKLQRGVVHKCQTTAEIAKIIGCPESTIIQTLEEYNQAFKDQRDKKFGKTALLQSIDKPPFYVGEERLCRHFCCGGLLFNTEAEVLDKYGAVMPGLYVAGEASGGVFGKDRLGGTSLLSCVVYGRIAGQNAALRSKLVG